MRQLILALAMVVMASPGQAQEITEEQRQNLNNLQHEITFCAVFYNISEEGLRKMDTAEGLKLAQHTEILKNELTEFAATLGLFIGMNIEAMNARVEMAMDLMMDKMDNTYVNYSILLKEYAVQCADVYENSVTRAGGIMGK